VGDPTESVGVIADPVVLAECLGGRVVHPQALQLFMQGARILVLLDAVPEDYRGITLPEAYRQNEQMGIGTVIACGPLVGQMPTPYPGGFIGGPRDLLYEHVIFGAHAGKPVRLDFIRDQQYESDILCMSDRDIWCIANWPTGEKES